jgi:hypothetical protein
MVALRTSRPLGSGIKSRRLMELSTWTLEPARDRSSLQTVNEIHLASERWGCDMYIYSECLADGREMSDHRNLIRTRVRAMISCMQRQYQVKVASLVAGIRRGLSS